MADQFFTFDKTGKLTLHLHEHQDRTLYSQSQVTINLKGWRAGGTSLMPFWLMNEMQRCGPGNPALNYFCAMPTLAAGKKALIPEMIRVFCNLYELGIHNKNENTITITPTGDIKLWGHEQRERTAIHFVYADDPTSFGSMTSIGGVADEIGQVKFKLESWRTLESRLMTQRGRIAPGNRHPALRHLGFPKNLKNGRILAASTVWNLGWLQDLWDDYNRDLKLAAKEYVRELRSTLAPQKQAVKSKFRARWFLGNHTPQLNFIRFESSANPVNSPEELAKLKQAWPDWFYDMRIRAIFRKPAGTIFEHWNPSIHVWKRTENFNPDNLPAKWPRRVAIDFGKRNFWALFIAHDEERDRHIVYRAYHDAQLSNQERAEEIRRLEPNIAWCVAGQISEEEDRAELAAGGLMAVAPKFKPMWPQINLVASAVKNNRLYTFEGVCPEFETEMRAFTRPVDDSGVVDLDAEPEDHEAMHTISTVRYYGSWWFSGFATGNFQSVRAGGEGKMRADTTLAPESKKKPQPAASLIMAGSAKPHRRMIRARRYGYDEGVLEPHLDLDF